MKIMIAIFLLSGCRAQIPGKERKVPETERAAKMYAERMKSVCLSTSKNDAEYAACIGQKYEDLKK